MALVAEWRFTPATKNGIAVAVPCTVELVWGARELDTSRLAQVYQVMDEQPAASAHMAPRVRIVVGTDGHVPQGRPALLNGVHVEVTTEADLDPPR